MTFEHFSETNRKRCLKVFHPIDSWTVAEWGVAVAGEAGEICNAIKKLRRLEDGNNTAKDPQTREEAVQAIADEIADTIIYADLLATRLGINLDAAIVKKFNEVSKRMKSDIKL